MWVRESGVSWPKIRARHEAGMAHPAVILGRQRHTRFRSVRHGKVEAMCVWVKGAASQLLLSALDDHLALINVSRTVFRLLLLDARPNT